MAKTDSPEAAMDERPESTDRSLTEQGTELGTSQQGEDERPWKAQKEEWLIVLSIFLLFFMIALDATIIVPVLSVSSPRYSFPPIIYLPSIPFPACVKPRL